MSERSFVRAVIAECWARKLTIGIRRGALSPMTSISWTDAPRAMPIASGRAQVSPRLELLQEFNHSLLVFGAQLAEPPNDLAGVTPIGL